MQAMWLPLVDEALALVDDSNLPPAGRMIVRLVAKTHHDAGGWDEGLVFFSTREAAKLLVRRPEVDRPPCHSSVSRTIPKLLDRGVLIGGVVGGRYYLAVNAAAGEWRVTWRGGKFAAIQSLEIEERRLVDEGWPHHPGLRVAPYSATRTVSASRSKRVFATWAATRDFLAMHDSQCFAEGAPDSASRLVSRIKGGSATRSSSASRPVRDAEEALRTLLEAVSTVGTVLSRDLERGDGHEEQREPSAAPQTTPVIDLRPHPSEVDVEETTQAVVRAIQERNRTLRGRAVEDLKARLRDQEGPINRRAALRVVREAPDRDRMNGLDLADLAATAARTPPAPEPPAVALALVEDDVDEAGFDVRNLIASTRDAVRGGGGRLVAHDSSEEA